MEQEDDSALEHVARNFAKWVRRVARGIRAHKEDERTQYAARRSGAAWGQHGLTQEEEVNRKARDKARHNFRYAEVLYKSVMFFL